MSKSSLIFGFPSSMTSSLVDPDDGSSPIPPVSAIRTRRNASVYIPMVQLRSVDEGEEVIVRREELEVHGNDEVLDEHGDTGTFLVTRRESRYFLSPVDGEYVAAIPYYISSFARRFRSKPLRKCISIALHILAVLCNVTIIAACAQASFTLPYNRNTPDTLQTGAIVWLTTTNGLIIGIGSVLAYLLAAGIGFPVLAYGSSGWEFFTPSSVVGKYAGGYLYGFVVCAVITGVAVRRYGADYSESARKWLKTTLACMALGNLGIYAVAIPWQWALLSGHQAWVKGFLYFVPWDALKVVAAALLTPLPWWIRNSLCRGRRE